MINDKLLLQEAKNRKIKVNKREMEESVEKIKSRFEMNEKGEKLQPKESEALFQSELKKEGLSEKEFEDRIKDQYSVIKLIEQEVKAKIDKPSDKQMKEVFDKFVGIRNQMGDKIGAAFATSGDQSGGKETTIFSIIQAMLIYGMIIVGDPLDATGHYGVSCTGAPDQKAVSNALKLGKRVALLVKKLRG